jgi:ribosomal protein S11
MARPSPLRLAGTLHTCIRRRNFSKSTFLHDDKPPPNSQFSPRTHQPRTSMSETPKQDILKLIEGVLSGKHLAFGRNRAFGRNTGVSSPSSSSTSSPSSPTYDSDIFKPIDLSEEQQRDPAVAQTRPAPLPLPYGVLRRPGYFHLHFVTETKNTHVTITDYKREVVVSMSAGQVGTYKHSKRASHEAGYDTAVAVFERFLKKDYKIEQLELVLKGFGPGRAGGVSALNGQYGEPFMKKVVRVTDATKLRIGGTRLRNKKRN